MNRRGHEIYFRIHRQGLLTMCITVSIVDCTFKANYTKDDMQQRVQSWTRKYGPICKQRLGHDWYVFLTDPGDFEKVFRNDRKYPFRGILPLIKVYTMRTQTKPGLTAL